MSQVKLNEENIKILAVDDHELILGSTVQVLKQRYPKVEMHTAKTAWEALEKLDKVKPNLFVVDISIPDKEGGSARSDVGINLIKTAMERYPLLPIVVQSADFRPLVKLKFAIHEHGAGFIVAEKKLTTQEMLTRVDWAFNGVTYTPKEMRSGLEIKEDWLKVLDLAFNHGLQDKAIAEQMNIGERTVRRHWSNIQDALGIYDCPEKRVNLRIQTGIRAREEGLID
ncbi:response regulator receiver protein [Rivularia sp. IAM M-261]|nr:response regulator receiver protein [Rivularia sp. IAM M-261]